ncbi:MAG TPA: helix-hairpin-helix domain-containing protein [Pedobacter sp.]|uniref:ComEA family DNA-binding protein n=1 Tax=Pedobacter sp. TaxID=1411316 RepID=UPI002CCCA08A|nr:helix-hairpin-helix domain-containing protein [Pedobacter sp.]HMI05680.1 helix-hairpin-helix domain-containing protein [Pedobacter sp.]
MRKWLNLYFDLNKREFNGLLVLAGLIAMLTAAPYLYEAAWNENHTEMTDRLIVQALIAQLQSEHKYPGNKQVHVKGGDRHGQGKKYSTLLFPFDPNAIGMDGWQRLGLSAKQSAAILKYVAKGGRFRKKEDLQKMYTISPKLYKALAPYVNIPPATVPEDPSKRTGGTWPDYEKTALKIVEINSADSTSLCEIRGIGPAFASRIIKYRTRIGGFYHKTQLMEVFGLDSLKYREISGQVSTDQELIKKISINTAAFEDLKNHPYLRYKQINALIQYRKQHGNYSNIADLTKVLLLNPETIARMAPYLVFQ